MKIHIDTSSEQEKAKAKKIAPSTGSPTAKGKTKPTSSSSSPSTQAPGSQPPGAQPPVPGQPGATPKKKVNLPKSPPKEPKPPKDVAAARKQQTRVLKERQKRETQGKNYGSRDIDAGSGFWPPLSPLL